MILRCRLNSEENVQMVTALILQLIQSIIRLSDDDDDDADGDGDALASEPELQKVWYKPLLFLWGPVKYNQCL